MARRVARHLEAVRPAQRLVVDAVILEQPVYISRKRAFGPAPLGRRSDSFKPASMEVLQRSLGDALGCRDLVPCARLGREPRGDDAIGEVELVEKRSALGR